MTSQSPYSQTLQTSGRTACRRFGLGILRFALTLGGCSALFGVGAAYAEPLSAPSFSGSLVPNPDPLSIDAGPLGSVFVGGQLIGIGALQTHPTHAGGTGNEGSFVDVTALRSSFKRPRGRCSSTFRGARILCQSSAPPICKRQRRQASYTVQFLLLMPRR